MAKPQNRFGWWNLSLRIRTSGIKPLAESLGAFSKTE